MAGLRAGWPQPSNADVYLGSFLRNAVTTGKRGWPRPRGAGAPWIGGWPRRRRTAGAACRAEELCPVELNRDRLRLALLARCRQERVEPPGPSRAERILGTAEAAFARLFTTRTAGRLTTDTAARLQELITVGDIEERADGSGFLQELKADPGQPGLETLLGEIAKLDRVTAIGLSAGLFADAAEKLVAAWRSRAARMYPSDFAKAPELVRLTLLAALCQVRKAELTDGLVELLIELVHRISVRAERKVENELTSEFRRVHGKHGILFKLAAAAVDHPDEIARAALYPVVGEATLRDLVAEARANEQSFNTRVRVQLRSSYSHHYRRGLPKLLKALTFRCNNIVHKPVLDALELLQCYSDSADKFYAVADRVPLDHVVPDDWRPAVVDERGRVERILYELCVLVALRAAIRRREIWVEGASQWRNPEDDLPADFEASRDVHYQALGKPRWRCSGWAPTWASRGSPTAPPQPEARPTTRQCCGGCGGCSSTATTCATRSAAWSTRRSRPATPPCGVRVPRARRTPASSGPGRRTS